MQAAPRVIVTRPAREAAQWVSALQARGVQAQALSPLEIAAVSDADLCAALAAAQRAWQGYAAVMFVSPNAVRFFFGSNRPETLDTQAVIAINLEAKNTPRIWAPGPGTAAALRQAGVPAQCIDEPRAQAQQFDSEALWAQVGAQMRPGSRLLVVRGSSGVAALAQTASPSRHGGQGRNWLAQQVQAVGGAVDFVAAYERRAVGLNAAQCARIAQAVVDNAVWLISSSEVLDCLRAGAPHQIWTQARALATHPRIAVAAQAAGFAQVRHCRPGIDDVVASIKSWNL